MRSGRLTAGDNGPDGEGEKEGSLMGGMEGILGDQGNRSGKQMKKRERERERERARERSGFLWQMGCETIRGGASSLDPRGGEGGLGFGWSASQKPQWPLECVHLSSPTHSNDFNPELDPSPTWDEEEDLAAFS